MNKLKMTYSLSMVSGTRLIILVVSFGINIIILLLLYITKLIYIFI